MGESITRGVPVGLKRIQPTCFPSFRPSSNTLEERGRKGQPGHLIKDPPICISIIAALREEHSRPLPPPNLIFPFLFFWLQDRVGNYRI